ncbi:MAG: NAD(P)-dependent oxidoreductase [Flavobacteriales bacterium]|jgi:nucleoside-diphosphate-sugar epimerase|nr:NAD(P)-dependent oxidoreductase [Flavobacteriales bacterium]
MKTALITGITSYIGTELAKKLSCNGVQVFVVIRPSSDKSLIPLCVDNECIYIHDGTTESMIKIVKLVKPDIVYHLASEYLIAPNPQQIDSLLSSNIIFGAQLLESLRLYGGPVKIIYTGTYAQYYDSNTARPLNLYSVTKQTFDNFLDYYKDAEGFVFSTLILYDTYGPMDKRFKLLSSIYKAWKEKSIFSLPLDDIYVDMVYIKDVVSALYRVYELQSLNESSVNGKRFSVTSGVRYKISEVVSIFEDVCKCSIKTKMGGYAMPKRKIISPWIGETVPGWKSNTSLKNGIRMFINEQVGK